MRFAKQKRHRKTIKRFCACFGFREPFKVLCDGTFVHHLVANRLADTTVSNTLGAPVQLFTTRCVIEELKSLGSSHAESFRASCRDYKIARCDHEEKESALNCIIKIIGDNNPEHFFVATQDIDLRERCRKIPGVPVLYGLRNALLLEKLSKFQDEYLKAAEDERSRMTDSEFKLLHKRLKNTHGLKDLSTDENGSDDEDLPLQNPVKRPLRKMDTKDTVQFKRKKAKGPNPLSCKKKKSTSNSGPNVRKTDETGSDAKRSRSRKRKRSHTAKTSNNGATN
ncbi:unnamed protein product [Amaranthus hypochondriacus]